MRTARNLSVVLALSLTPLPALAQTEAFEAAMQDALAEAGLASSLIRCTSLFRAFRLYAGEETEVGATAAMRETDLAVASVVIWQSDTGTQDTSAAFDQIVPMVGEATDLYVARMSTNQEADGSVFDSAIEAELAFCTALHGEIEAQSDG